jgi:hypothetical protein
MPRYFHGRNIRRTFRIHQNTALPSGNHVTNNLLNDIPSLVKTYTCQCNCQWHYDMLQRACQRRSARVGLRQLDASMQIELTYDTIRPVGSVVVGVDKKELFRCISNIVNNTVKFSPGKRVRVQVTHGDLMPRNTDTWQRFAIGKERLTPFGGHFVRRHTSSTSSSRV